MREKFKKIWNLALPYQDKRDDKGHTEAVVNYALKLLKNIKADEEIVIPAAILHDTGWSQLSEEERFYVFRNKITKEVEMKIKSKLNVRIKHAREGAILAQKILREADVGYDKNKIKRIVKIVKNHDTDKDTSSIEESLVRDADKLWTFSKTGFEADIRRFGLPEEECHKMAAERVNIPNYFNTEAAKKIAREELEKRKQEFKISEITHG